MKLLNPNLPPNTVRATRVQAVVLDWAGTTVDFGSVAPVYTLQKVFAQAGIALENEQTRRDMGLPKKEHIRAILALPEVGMAWEARHGRPASDADVEALYQQFVPLQLSCLAEHAVLIPGVREAVQCCRDRGFKIGSTTGYTRAMLEVLLELSAQAGYIPDCSMAPEDVGAGRPHPFMLYEIAVRLKVYPMSAIVKIGDTPADIYEALNAGCWAIGVAGTGNRIGISRGEFEGMPGADREIRLTQSRAELQNAGAHYVIDTLSEIPALLDTIDLRLGAG